jgi:hypothetical protein
MPVIPKCLGSLACYVFAAARQFVGHLILNGNVVLLSNDH